MRAAIAAAAMLGALAVACSGDDGEGSLGEGAGRSSESTTSSTATTVPVTTTTAATDSGLQRLTVEVIEQRNQDPRIFTQGLELHDGALYVSGGLYGESSVQVLDPESGQLRARYGLADEHFAEGLTVVDDEVVVLTWREGTALVLDSSNLRRRGEYAYEGEGWGLCDDGSRLVMSDGSASLQFRDRETFAPVGSVAVTLEGQPLSQLNELECVDGDVWANVWRQDTIVRIDPATGYVTATVDASALKPDEVRNDSEAVLNGIAHDADDGTFLLTGKRWPALFVVRFVPAG